MTLLQEQAYWSNFWSNPCQKFFESSLLINKVLKHLKGYLNGVIIDYGCGRGLYINKLRDNGLTVYGLDLLRSQFIGEGLIQGSIYESPFKDSSVNVCLALLLVEHVSIDLFFNECSRVLKAEGLLIILVPNLSNPLVYCFRLLKKLFSQINHLYSKSSIIECGLNNGFNLLSVESLCNAWLLMIFKKESKP